MADYTIDLRSPQDSFARTAKMLRVVDGDTLDMRIDLGWKISISEHVRLFGVDTPESRGPERAAGKWIAGQVESWFDENGTDCRIRSNQFRPDKYGRSLVQVWASDQCLNRWLLDSGLAWPASSSGTIVGCRDVESLRLPDGIKQQVREAMC